MTTDERVLLTGDDVPYHLRPDAPALAECSGCHRKTWAESEPGKPCAMPQPGGRVCEGTMQAPGTAERVLDMNAPRRPVSVRLIAVVTHDDGVTATMETAELEHGGPNAEPCACAQDRPLSGPCRCVWARLGIDTRYERDDYYPYSDRAYLTSAEQYVRLDLRARALDPFAPHLYTITYRLPETANEETGARP
jgi:hypothetical protein